jgi:hypothetical protein
MRYPIVILLLAICFPALAVDFSSELAGLDGKPLATEGRSVTLRNVALSALMATYKDEQSLAGLEKFKRYQLAQKLSAEGDISLTLEEAKMLRDLIGKSFGPAVVGPVWTLIPDQVK